MLQNLQKLSSTLSAIIIMLAFSTLTMSEAFTQTIRYVKPGGTGDGTSWANASGNLQAMINASVANDQVWVAAGTYKPTTGTDRTVSFTMKNGVAIYGGFPNTGNPVMADRDWVANETILSGDIGTTGNNSDNSYHVIFNSDIGITATAIFDGFTITGGNANDGTGTNSVGGGMYNRYSSPSLVNCNFSDNSASSTTSIRGGGGMYNRDNSPSLVNCNFSGNSAHGTEYSGGGGMYNRNSSPSLVNCSFLGNFASGGGYCGGAGMFNYESSPSLVNCIFLGNRTSTWDGEYSGGAGMFNYISTPSLVNCSFSGNYARSIISNSGGGGILNHASTTSLVNCIIWNNRIINDTTSTSASIYNIGFSTTTISYSLIANSGGSGSWDVKIGTNGGNNIDADPLFKQDVSLESMPTTTGNLRLKVNSPAIDAGSNGAVPAGVTTDLDGESRIYNGTVDMGAYEFQGETCTNPTTGGVIANNQTICSGEVPAAFTSVSLPTGHSGTLEYHWQLNTVSSTATFDKWEDVGTNTETYDHVGTLTQTTWFRRLARVTCDPVSWASATASNVVEVEVYESLKAGTATGTQTICYNQTPTELSSTDATGGSGTYAYQWQVQTGKNWEDISGEDALTFQPGTLTQTTTYRLAQTDEFCNPDQTVYTNELIVTVHNQLQAGTATSTQTICYNQTPAELSSTSATGGSGTYAHQWQVQSGKSWEDISGENALTYQPGTLTQTTTYRLAQTDEFCNPDQMVYTNELIVTVHNQLQAGTATGTQTICYDQAPTELSSTSATGGSGTYAYQWQVQSGKSWEDISGENALTYQPGTLTQTTTYRLAQTDEFCNPDQTVYTDNIIVTVHDQLQAGTATGTQTICYDQAPTELSSTAATGGSVTYAYLWQVQSGKSWEDISGENAMTYQPGTLTQTTTYRLAQTDEFCNPDQTVYTNDIIVTVHDQLTLSCPDDFDVDTDPGVCTASVTFSAIAGGTPTPDVTYKVDNIEITSPHNFPTGATTVMVTAENNCGLLTCSFTVTVTDNQYPTIENLPKNIAQPNDTGSCGATVTWTGPTSADNCDGHSINQTEGAPSGSNFAVGIHTITYKATDASGNKVSDSFTITITDDEKPVVETKDISIQLDVTGNATITPADIDNGSTDNCGIASYTLDIDQFTAANKGNNAVTLTVTDIHGNSDSKTANVFVQSIPAPWKECDTHVSANGTADYDFPPANPAFHLTATGQSTTTRDVHHVVYQDVCDEQFTIIARLTGMQNLGWGGVVVRKNCNSSAAAILVKTQLSNRVIVGYRKAEGLAMVNSGAIATIKWMKIQRNGKNYKVFTSANGTTWQQRYNGTLANLADCVQAGIFLESIYANRTARADFMNVSLTLLKSSYESVAWEEVSPADETQRVELYPNPADDYLIVSIPENDTKVSYQLTDMDGRLIQQNHFTGSEAVLDLSNLRPGMYVLRLDVKGEIVTKRIVVM